MALLVCLAVSFVCGRGSNATSAGKAYSTTKEATVQNALEEETVARRIFASVLTVATLVISIIGFLLMIFIGNPVAVGGKRFFMESRSLKHSAGFGKLLYIFSNHYSNVVKTMFLRDLYTFLWTLLLFIPGVIKYYEYHMVPYILSENPDMDSKEVFQLSKQMMQGQKWDTFVLHISFFGWYLLGVCCCCGGLIFVDPYVEATLAELYAVSRDKVGTVGLRGFVETEVVDRIPR